MKNNLASRIIDKMYENDEFTKWLGAERIDESPGSSILRMTVRKEMTNGFGIAHGGITFSFADSALAFAANSRGQHAVSIETSISHTKGCRVGDVITAVATEDSVSPKLGHYTVRVTNQNDEVVALFKGTVFRKKTEWFSEGK